MAVNTVARPAARRKRTTGPAGRRRSTTIFFNTVAVIFALIMFFPVYWMLATAFKPSSKSLEALRAYNEGLQLAHQGKNSEALKKFQASIQADPEFALAHAKLGQTYASLGYDTEAEQSSRRAVELAERLPAQEKYLIAAGHARIVNDSGKAIEAYENLAKVSPEDPEVQHRIRRILMVARLDVALLIAIVFVMTAKPWL